MKPHRSRIGRFTAAVVLGALLPLVAAAAEPLKIGVIDDMGGPYSSVSGPGSVFAARMAIQDFGGEVLGRKIELLTADDQNKPDIGLGTARRWYDQDGVSMITGLANSSIALGVQKLAMDRKKINIVVSAASGELTAKSCSPTGFHWMYNTVAFARGTVEGLSTQPGQKWFFITPDYAFGQTMQADATRFIEAKGGRVIGSVKQPLGTTDYSSYMLQAAASGADVVALASAGTDLENALKAAREFGLATSGKKIAVFFIQTGSILALGLPVIQDTLAPTTFFPSMNDGAMKWSQRFMAEGPTKKPPTNAQAGVYSAVMHYLKAVRAAATDDGPKVAEQIRRMPIDDVTGHGFLVRKDGQVLRDVYVTRIKKPSESKSPLDLVQSVTTIPGAVAFQSLPEGGCEWANR